MSIARSGLVVFSEWSRGGVLRCASHLPLATFWPRLWRYLCLRLRRWGRTRLRRWGRTRLRRRGERAFGAGDERAFGAGDERAFGAGGERAFGAGANAPSTLCSEECFIHRRAMRVAR